MARLWWGGLLALALLAPCARNVRADAKTSIVLVTVDTLRADVTSPYGAAPDLTPALSALAAQAVQFANAFTAMPTTGPAHLSMLTGLYPPQHGALQNGVAARPGTRSLAALMRASGRRTGAFVSVHHLSAATLGLDGFEAWDAPDDVRDGALTVAAAERWVGGLGGAPFFLWVHLFDPHTPYQAHADVPASVAEPLQALAAVHAPRRGAFEAPSYDARQREKLALLYRADVHYADAQVGRLLAFLDRAGLASHTAVAVTADHGEVLGEAVERYGYGFDHGEFLLPMEVRVPLWVRLPDGPRGVVEERPVETRAVFGTLLAAAGVPAPADAPALPVAGATAGTARPALVFRRSFQAKTLRPALRGSRLGATDGNTLVVRVEQDGDVRFEAWQAATSVAGLVPASPPATEALLPAVEGAASHYLGRETAREQTIDAPTRERLRALGYAD